MQNIAFDPVRIRPHVGTRLIGKKLCLVNQKRKEE